MTESNVAEIANDPNLETIIYVSGIRDGDSVMTLDVYTRDEGNAIAVLESLRKAIDVLLADCRRSAKRKAPGRGTTVSHAGILWPLNERPKNVIV